MSAILKREARTGTECVEFFCSFALFCSISFLHELPVSANQFTSRLSALPVPSMAPFTLLPQILVVQSPPPPQ